MAGIRCSECGLVICNGDCKYNDLNDSIFTEQYSTTYKSTDEPMAVPSKDRRKFLKEFYSEIQKAQARNPEDWYKCSECLAIIHREYRDNHARAHGSAIRWIKIDLTDTTNNDDDDVLTVEQSLSKLSKACEGCVGDESCCALAGLKAAGWDVQINPAIAYDDRKGYQITVLEPKKR